MGCRFLHLPKPAPSRSARTLTLLPAPDRLGSFVRLALGGMVDEESVARAQECCYVKTLAVQVGEGAAVLRGCAADVYVTSEMSHADVLAANAQVRRSGVEHPGFRGVAFLLLGRG